MKYAALLTFTALVLTSIQGCATKTYGRQGALTSHEQDTMTCREIDLEIAKVGGFVEHVNRESQFSGRDVLAILGDFGIGNGLEKSAALESAKSRSEMLNSLKKDKNCQRLSTEAVQYTSSLTDDLDKLNNLYKNGTITPEEYKQAKARLLNMPDVSAKSFTQFDASTSENNRSLTPGAMAFSAEKMTIEAGCVTLSGTRPAAKAIQREGALEVYDIECGDRHMIVRCEYHICKLMK